MLPAARRGTAVAVAVAVVVGVVVAVVVAVVVVAAVVVAVVLVAVAGGPSRGQAGTRSRSRQIEYPALAGLRSPRLQHGRLVLNWMEEPHI